MEDEREFMDMIDENGDSVTVEFIGYFYYNGVQYIVLADYEELEEIDEDADQEIFFMKVTPLEGDEEEYSPIDEDLADELFEAYVNSQEEEDEEEPENP